MAKQIRIAFLGNQIAYGGGAKSLLLMIKSLSRKHSNLKFFLYVTNVFSETMKQEFEGYVEFVKKISVPELSASQAETIEANQLLVEHLSIDHDLVHDFISDLKINRIDILHINNSVFSPIYPILKANINVKIISHIREWICWNGIHNKQRFIINNILNFSDAIIGISNYEIEPFLKHQNSHIIPNPFDFKEISFIESDTKKIKDKYKIPHHKQIIGMMSSSNEKKGVLDFIEALSLFKEKYGNNHKVTFVFAGLQLDTFSLIKAILKKHLFKREVFLLKVWNYVKKHNVKNDIIFIKTQKNILDVINAFDIAVRPSYSGDPWGRDIIEYMALKKPIVATGSESIFLKNKETGMLVKPRDITALADAFNYLLSNSSEGKKMGLAGYSLVSAECDINTFYCKVLKVYKSVITF